MGNVKSISSFEYVGPRWPMLFLFFLSGVAALIYQILWTKQLALVFGVTIFATSTVVTTFMCGLALGSLYFGRWVGRWKRLLVVFAALEVGIAVLGLLFPVITSVILKPIYAYCYGLFGDSRFIMTLIRFSLSVIVLLLPTFLMGGTLPVISRAYIHKIKCLGSSVAKLYWVNNFGAFLGCLLAGFLFLEFLGWNYTLVLAVLLNLFAALCSLLLAKLGSRKTEEKTPELEPVPIDCPEDDTLSRPVKVALWVFGIEGFTSLAYQMAWIRLLIFFVSSNIYGITTIIATYLAGLALGAFVVKRWIDRSRSLYRMLGIIELGIGLLALTTIPILPRILDLQLFVQLNSPLTSWPIFNRFAARFVLCFIVILLPTSLMGATMPVVSRIYVGQLHKLGRKIGIIGCLDTVGSILGSLAGGFLLIPFLGIQRTIVATAIINLALAVWIFAEDPFGRRKVFLRLGFITAAASVLVASAVLFVKPVPLGLYSASLKNTEVDILHYSEDAESTVTVAESFNFARTLYVNEAIVALSTIYDRPSHELIAHVPLLLHPDPQRALLIGFGAGFTSWACRVHDVQVDVVELSPGVPRSNHLFRPYVDVDILDDPGVHLRIDDGRNYVLGTKQKYDMIQAGIIHPGQSSGNASFYSVDFYRNCKRILTPDGVMCQWLPLHNIPVEDFKMLIRSFQAVFPHTSIWFKYTTDFCMLIGTNKPLEIDFQDFERRVNQPSVRNHLARSIIVDPYDLLDSYLLADDAVQQMVGSGVLDTDNHPYIEFHMKNSTPLDKLDNIKLLGKVRQPVWPRLVNIPPQRTKQVKQRLDRWFQATQHLIHGQYLGEILELYARPTDREYQQNWKKVQATFQKARKQNPDDKRADFFWRRYEAIMNLKLGIKSMYLGRPDYAIAHYNTAIELSPEMIIGAKARYGRDLVLEKWPQLANPNPELESFDKDSGNRGRLPIYRKENSPPHP